MRCRLLERLALATVMLPLACGAATQAWAQDEPLLVTFGKAAATREGDFNHRQVIYLSVPATLHDRLYLRIFDPGISSQFDEIRNGGQDARTRFSVYGGQGAFAAAAAKPGIVTDEEATAGKLITAMEFGNEPSAIGRWVTIAVLDPRQGDAVGDKVIFHLMVEGIGGQSGNVFDVFLSAREQRNLMPEGARMFSFAPTVRVPNRTSITELRFHVPADVTSLVVNNFDLAFAKLTLETAFASVALRASGQDEWQASPAPVAVDQRDTDAAITFDGGKEVPNDANFSITDAAGRLIPIELPPRLWLPLRRPVPAVDVSYLADCTSVAFDAARSSDPKGGRLDFTWRFGDGATAKGQEARHDYAKPGHYSARLELRGSSEQVGDGAAVDLDVFVKRPPIAQAKTLQRVAVGETVIFDGSASSPGDGAINRMVWSFNDGVELVGPVVQRAFKIPGRYDATLRIEDTTGRVCNSAIDQQTIVINAQPVAVAGENKRVAIGDAIAFNGARSYDTDGTITRYQWDFGDGTRADGAAAQHAYAGPGSYTVTLTVTDDAGVANSTASDRLTVLVHAPPVAVAGRDIAAAIGQPLTFDGTVSHVPDGRIVAYDWDFGDGSKGSGERPVYAYQQSGTYTVRLTVRDDSATRTATAMSTLKVRVNEPPVAVAGPDQLVTTSLVHFDGTASHDPDGSIIDYTWDFGDGTTGSGATADHVYARHGRFRARLTVTDDSGTQRNTGTSTANVVIKTPPIADAGARLVGAPGEKLVFDASRSLDPDGDITAYEWSFGDGAKANGRVASHVFTKPGTYDVRLTVKDDSGTANGIDFAETRAVINAPPVAKAGANLIVAPGDQVRLDASSSYAPNGKIVSYRWDFSDGGSPVNGAKVTRRFDKPGIYTAHLTVTDDSGATNSTAADEIKIAVNDRPVAVAGPDIVTDRLVVAFDGTQSVDADGDPLTFRWDFGDGTTGAGAKVLHTYAEGGTYPVVLVVDDGKALSNSTSRATLQLTIHRPPTAVAGDNRRVCTGDVITFDGSKSRDQQGGALRYAWDFGDGTTSDIVNPTKTYKRAGAYPVTLTVQDNSGLPNSTHMQRIAVTVDQGPIAVAGQNFEACARSEVHFDGSKSFDPHGAITRFTWDFGDGGSGGGDRPAHIYENPGEYRVFLKIEGTGVGQCEPTSTDQITARIIKGPVPIIVAREAAPVSETVSFDGSGSYMTGGRILDYQWDFGDGATARGPKVDHTYAEAGSYNVTLALNSDSLSPTCQGVTGHHAIRVNAPPNPVIAAAKAVAAGEDVTFDGSGSSHAGGGIVAYDWDFGDGTRGSGVEARHRYRDAGQYTARLRVTDDAGLANSSAVAEVPITVNAPPAPPVSMPAKACVGDDVAFKVAAPSSTTGAAVAQPTWVFGGKDSESGADVVRQFTRPGTYDVTMTPDDGKHLSTSRSPTSELLHVDRPPVAVAGPERLACPDADVAFDGSGSSAPDGKLVRYAWNFGDGASLDGARVVHAYARPGTYDVKLTVTDDSGSPCASKTDTTRVVVDATPIAAAAPLKEAFIGGANDAAMLDASPSRHPDGRALEFLWQIGDGSTETGERVRHAFRKAGDIPVKLTVRDTTGLSCGAAAESFTVKVRLRSANGAN